jgi:hypothetical protein
MFKNIVAGLVAGALGVLVLNLITYLDMLLRGRPPSKMPSEVAGVYAGRMGLEPLAMDHQEPKAEHRRSAAGALMGYGAGLGIGLAYGLIRTAGRFVPVPHASLAVGGAAMAASDLPARKAGVTDPAEWDTMAWVSDIVPHAAHGLVTVPAFNSLTRDRIKQRRHSRSATDRR